MGKVLTKSQTVLELQLGGILGLVFSAPEVEGEEHRYNAMQVDKRVWEDMGKPEVITVTIEPGDKLNEEE